MSKRYNEQTFRANVGGTIVEFDCYTTNTRSGFCHTAVCRTHPMTNTKVSYLNRTWERFRYETTLARAIDKLPKALQEGARAILIDGKAEEEYNRCNAQFDAFKKLHDGLTEENKKRLADSGIEMQTEGDVQGVMGIMALMSVMQ